MGWDNAHGALGDANTIDGPSAPHMTKEMT